MLDFMQIMQRFRTQQIADLGEKYIETLVLKFKYP